MGIFLILLPAALISRFKTPESRPYWPRGRAFPTLLVTVGDPDIKEEKLLKGHSIMGRNYKVYLDGYGLLPYRKDEVKESPRNEFLYWTDDG